MTNPINSYEALLERIWADEDFKKGFIADPKPVLADAGVKVSDSSVKVEVHEDEPNLRNYVLPRKEQLKRYNLEGQNSIISQVIQKSLADDAFKVSDFKIKPRQNSNGWTILQPVSANT